MLKLISSFFLLFCQEATFATILTAGFLFLQSSLFLELSYLSSFGMILNVLLKGVFRVPPDFIGSHSEFAFPSGHMQHSVLFYSFLALYFPSRIFRWALSIILLGIGEALVYFHFHTVIDVIGGLVSALTILIIYETVIKRLSLNWQIILMSSLAGLMMRCNQILYLHIPKHAWYAFFSMVILSVIRPWLHNWRCSNLWCKTRNQTS